MANISNNDRFENLHRDLSNYEETVLNRFFKPKVEAIRARLHTFREKALSIEPAGEMPYYEQMFHQKLRDLIARHAEPSEIFNRDFAFQVDWLVREVDSIQKKIDEALQIPKDYLYESEVRQIIKRPGPCFDLFKEIAPMITLGIYDPSYLCRSNLTEEGVKKDRTLFKALHQKLQALPEKIAKIQGALRPEALAEARTRERSYLNLFLKAVKYPFSICRRRPG